MVENRSGFNQSSDLSVFNKRKQPKEIEEFFESTRNFYKNRETKQTTLETKSSKHTLE